MAVEEDNDVTRSCITTGLLGSNESNSLLMPLD